MKQSVKILVAIVGDNELFLWLLFWFLSLGFSSSLFHGGGRFSDSVTVTVTVTVTVAGGKGRQLRKRGRLIAQRLGVGTCVGSLCDFSSVTNLGVLNPKLRFRPSHF